MNKLVSTTRRLLLWSSALSLVSMTAAHAQNAGTPPVEPQQPSVSGVVAATPAGGQDDAGDIIVTARKRDETLISVPVVVTAVGAPELQRRGVVNLDGLSRIVPQLIIAPQGGSVQGGNVAIRGISGPDSNPFGDQAVSFNIDGVQVAKASVRRMSDTDIAQVEVLKGPQALFFGKNSPAGIVSIRTADPGDHFEAGARAGYEFEAREIRGEGYVSGPVSDTLGLRLAGTASRMSGYLKDQTPEGLPGFTPEHGRNPRVRDYALRGTAKWTPTDAFSARLKVNYGHVKQNGPAAITEFIICPLGVRGTGGGGQCTVGDSNVNAGYGTFLATLPGTQNHFRADGQNFLVQDQILTSLELNYNVSDEITLTSVTGYYDVDLDQCQNYNNDFSIILPSCNTYKDKEFSQELRINTDYDGPLNFTGGVYYSKVKASTGSLTYGFGNGFDLIPGFGGNVTTPILFNDYFLEMKGTAYSAYLQLSYKPIETVEINVGGRYSYEKKRLPLVQDGITTGTGAILTPASALNLAKRKDSWNDFSPEVTLSYRPTSSLTLFGSYKHGFLSGGFNSSSSSFADPDPTTPINEIDISYDPQTIKGFEAGVKTALLDNALRFNLSAYTYKVQDLQVTNFTGTISTIRNAGAVSIKGIEADFNYRTPLDGLSVHGAASYNKGKYTSFPAAPCYLGQTVAQGCIGGSQDLGDTELIRAPKWNLSAGFNFETLMGMGLKLGVSGDATHSSSFLTDATSAPDGRQPSYTLLDASARIGAEDDGWQLAVIGRNLSNKHYFVASTDVPVDTIVPGGGDRFASVGRGREIWLQASFKFGQ